MEDKEPYEDRNKKRIKQPVSVPFLWEEKPGTPKKDWKPTFHPVFPARPPPSPPSPPPVKLIASIPFKWEEKPGTPFPFLYGQQPPEPPLPPPPMSPPPPPPPTVKLIASIPFKWEEKPGTPLPFFSGQQPPEPPLPLPPMITSSYRSHELYSQEIDKLWENGNDGDDEMFESEGYETDNSFSSAPSILPANRLAAPVTKIAPPSPGSEAGSSTSSYATGTTSLVGLPFLQSLFPLLPPNSSIVWKEPTRIASKGTSINDCDKESNCSFAIRKPLTLGELILMSRRKSNRRKAVEEHNFSMEFIKSGIGCFNFGSSNGIQALKANWKKQLQLKLI